MDKGGISLLLGLMLCCPSIFLKAQPLPFIKVWGDSKTFEQGSAVCQFPSGSIFYYGNATADSIGGNDLVLVKFDQNGQLIWQKYLGGTLEDFSAGMIQYDDSSLVLTGYKNDFSTFRREAFLMKVDTLGQMIWEHFYGNPSYSTTLKTIIKTEDGGLLACGSRADTSGNDSYIIRTDAEGNMLWESDYRIPDDDLAHAAVELPNGNFLVAGDYEHVSPPANPYYTPYLIRLDQQGKWTEEWLIAPSLNSGAQNIIATQDGGFLLVGESFPDSLETAFDMLVIKLDSTITEQWRTYIGEAEGEAAFNAFETAAGNFVVAGYGFNLPGGSTDLTVSILDPSGLEIDRNYYGGNSIDQAYDVAPSIYEGYLLSGFVTEGTDNQFVLVFDQMELPLSNAQSLSIPGPVKLFPNPIKRGDILKFESGSHKSYIEIWNLAGKRLVKNHLSPSIEIPEHWAPGMYWVKVVIDQEMVHYRKLVIY